MHNTESKLLQNITAEKSLKSKSSIYCPHCTRGKKRRSDSRNPNGFRAARFGANFYRYQRRFFMFVRYIFFFFSVRPSSRDNAITYVSRRANRRSNQDEACIIAILPDEFSFLLFRRIINEVLENRRIIKL